MSYSIRAMAVAAALALGLSAPSAVAATLTNGDFENGLTGWTVENTQGGRTVVERTSLFDVDGDNDATQAAEFNVGRTTARRGGATISQDFTVGVAGMFEFAVDVAAIDINGNADGGTFRLIVDGQVLDTFATGRVGSNVVEADTLFGTLDLGPGTYTFTVEITRRYTTVDNPVLPRQYVDSASITAVPLPASAALLLAALGGLGVMRRRANA